MKLNLFRKRRVKFLGRAGLNFDYAGNTYFIDSEMSFRKIDLIIYTKNVKLVSTNEVVNECLRQEVLDSLIKYLKEEEKLEIELMND